MARKYLEEKRPEFEENQVINAFLQSRGGNGKALAFVRHLYLLELPDINGDPNSEWIIDPERLGTAKDWRGFLEERRVKYVVRSAKYQQGWKGSTC